MRLLLLETEYRLLDGLKEILKQEKYIVDFAMNAEQGLPMALSNIYDIILIDHTPPALDGYEFLKTIRKNMIFSPVILISKDGHSEDLIYGLDIGADEYLVKPVKKLELLAHIRALTRRYTMMNCEMPRCGDLLLNRKKCELYCTQTQLYAPLGNKEAQLLEYLLLNQTQIISKEQIENKVWGYNSCHEYNSTEVYISFLRKKIKAVNSTTSIKTIRGVGYTLVEKC